MYAELHPPAARVNHAKQLGVKVGLGTDVAGGYSPSMLNALRSAVITSKALRMQHLAPTEHGTEPSPANSHLLDYKVSGVASAVCPTGYPLAVPLPVLLFWSALSCSKVRQWPCARASASRCRV